MQLSDAQRKEAIIHLNNSLLLLINTFDVSYFMEKAPNPQYLEHFPHEVHFSSSISGALKGLFCEIAPAGQTLITGQI